MRETIDQLAVSLKEKGPVILLESQSDDHPAGTLTYLAAAPRAVIQAYGSEVILNNKAGEVRRSQDPWQALSDFRRTYDDWIFGYLGYDLKNTLESLYSKNPDPVQAPDLYFMVPELLIEIDHETGGLKLIKGELPEVSGSKGLAAKAFSTAPVRPAISKEDYIDCIREAQSRIREGSFYEVNLSHQMRATCSGDSYDLYGKMRAVGPVPFGAYLSFDKWSVCCQSPERFLKKSGSRICSQPIKGTVRRGESTEEDARLKTELKSSLKDRAENLMIVDLVRNDLGRIAEKGTVQVSDLFEIQTFGTVHQMVSTIEARAGIDDPVEIIKACYPMGSMTGAPKISTMRSIEELEQYRRGIYSGAIGYIKPCGDFDFNVVIRTAIVSGNELFYAAGGAITGDSDPESEWEETLVKARAITGIMEDG